MSLLTNWLESLSYELEAGNECLRNVSKFSTCTNCLDSCDREAIIILEKKGIEIDTNKCSNCGRCIPVCPVQALKGESPQRKIQNDILVLDDMPIPTVNELIYLYKKGVKKIFIHLDESKVPMIDQALNEVNELLLMMGKELWEHVNSLETDNQQEQKLSRRDFFGKVTKDSKNLALTTVTPVKWRFNQDKYKGVLKFDGWNFFDIKLSPDKCTVCQACFQLCPEQVFMIKEEMLIINSENCNGCHLCADVCISNAITVESDIQSSKNISFQIWKQTCKNCKGEFVSWKQADHCFSCQESKKNNLLSFLHKK